jgi:hypothetical protein
VSAACHDQYGKVSFQHGVGYIDLIDVISKIVFIRPEG